MRNKRFESFCNYIGLENWDGAKFSNEEKWINDYKKQLRDTVTFMVYSHTRETIKSIRLPLKVWCGHYKNVLEDELLLKIFLNALKTLI
jgi:hypothetical protein